MNRIIFSGYKPLSAERVNGYLAVSYNEFKNFREVHQINLPVDEIEEGALEKIARSGALLIEWKDEKNKIHQLPNIKSICLMDLDSWGVSPKYPQIYPKKAASEAANSSSQ